MTGLRSLSTQLSSRGLPGTLALIGCVALGATCALATPAGATRGDDSRAVASALSVPAGDLPISGDPSASSPDAFRGVLAWSHLAVAAPGAQTPMQYHLALRANGAVADLPVPASSAPFDPEVGPGPRGGTVVVYDRCGAGGCAMYSYSLRGATERRIATRTPPGCIDEAPSVWGKNLIFVRSAAKVTRTRGTCRGGGRGLYVLTGNRTRLLRRGTTNGACQGCGADLRGNVVASNTSPDGLDDQLRIDFLGHRRGFLVYRDELNAFGGTGTAGSPELAGRYLYWQASQTGENGHEDRLYRARVSRGASCESDPRRFPSAPPSAAATSPFGLNLNGIAVDGAAIFYARSSGGSGATQAPLIGLFQAVSPPPAFSLGHGFFSGKSPPLGRQCGNFRR